MKRIVSTPRAPAAIGPYSQAIEVDGMLFTSGVIPIDPESGELVDGGIEEQAELVLRNIKALLEDSGSGMEHVVKTTVFIKDMNDFSQVNEIYAKYFDGDYPARSCVEVTRLPKDVLIEMEVIATI